MKHHSFLQGDISPATNGVAHALARFAVHVDITQLDDGLLLSQALSQKDVTISD